MQLDSLLIVLSLGLLLIVTHFIYRQFRLGHFSSEYKKTLFILKRYPLVKKAFSNSLHTPLFYPIKELEHTWTLEASHPLKTICTEMTPQGLAVSDDLVFLSAYCHGRQHYSVLYIFDKQQANLINTIPLPGRPHVGGLAFNKNKQELWVTITGKKHGSAAAISLSDILTFPEKATFPIAYTKIYTFPGISQASYISKWSDFLLAGTFERSKTGTLGLFPLNDETNNIPRFVSILKKAQGVAIYKDHYCLVSQSFGPRSSKVFIFSKEQLLQGNLQENKALKVIKFPPYLEQITVDDNFLYVVFESGASAYQKKTSPINNILVLSIPQLLEK